MGTTFPFFVKIARDELQASGFAIAVMAAAPFIGNLFSPVWARQMDGKDKLPFCVGAWVIARLLLFLMPFALTGNLFVLLVVGLQLIGTVSGPAYTSLMRDIYPDRARGSLMGYVRVVAQACMFIATLIVGRLLDAGVSYRWLFPIAGIFGLLAAWSFYKVRLLPEAKDQPIPPKTSLMQFLRETLAILKHNAAYRYFALSVFIYGFANLMVQPLYQLYQVDQLKITSTQIADLANITALLSIAGAFFWGRFMDRYTPPVTVMVSISLIALIPIVYLMANSVWVLYFAAALAGFGFAGIELSYLSSILLYAEPGRTAQYQSLHSLLLGVRGVLASLLGVPLMQEFGYVPVFMGALIVMIFGSGIQWLAVRENRARAEPHTD
jgi:MFS family permease